MRNTIKTLAAAACLALAASTTITGATAAPAQAGIIGGKISVTKTSNTGITISGNLTKRNGKYVMLAPMRQIGPGKNSRQAGIKDADAFYAPRGCTTPRQRGRNHPVYKPGTVHKINSLQHITLTVRC